MQEAVIQAFRSAGEGHSADFLLCDPELNVRFVQACKRSGTPGNAAVWNRLLLRIRKAGQLPKVPCGERKLTFEMMDTYSFGSEVALQLLSADYAMQLDEILCSPQTAAEFERLAEKYAPGHSAFEYRWAALALRKRVKKSKTLARKHFTPWLTKRLPKPVPLSRALSSRYEVPGVYIVSGSEQALYVGETAHLGGRVQRMLDAPSWMDLNPQKITLVPTTQGQSRHGRCRPFSSSVQGPCSIGGSSDPTRSR